MKAGKYDITIEQGSGLGLTVSFAPGGEQVDWTGCAARLQARAKHSSPDIIFALTTENGGIVMDGPAGKLRLVMSATAAALLKFAKAVYDLEIVPDGNEPYRLLQGNVFLAREVTR